MKTARRLSSTSTVKSPKVWRLRLYIAGNSSLCGAAVSNLERICHEHMRARYELEVVDLEKAPALAREDQIVAVPTLVRRSPGPVKKLIGDLSNEERVLRGLDLTPRLR